MTNPISLHAVLGAATVLCAAACGRSGLSTEAGAPIGTTSVDPGDSAPDSTPTGSDVLAVGFGNELRLISLDGTSRSLLKDDAFFSGVTGVDVIGNGRVLLVRSYAENSPETGMRLALVKSDGPVQWKQTFAVSFAGGHDVSALHWGLSLGEDGAVVFRVTDSQSIRVKTADGASSELVGFGPIGEPVAGFLPVGSWWDPAAPYAAQTTGWWRVGPSHELVGVGQSGGSPETNPRPVSFAGKLLWLRKGAENALLVQTSSGTATISLPGTTADASIRALGQGEMFVDDERWVLINSGISGRLLRVDLRSAHAEQLDLVAPSGYRPFADCQETTRLEDALEIDRDGRIFGAFRTNDHVAVFATTDGLHWSQVGGSYTGVGGVKVSVTRGTYAITGHVEVECWVGGPVWSSPAVADFVGNKTQLVRPGSKTQFILPGASRSSGGYVLSRSGRFGARWDVDPTTKAATLHILDLETGVQTVAATDAVGVHSAQPAWLWLP